MIPNRIAIDIDKNSMKPLPRSYQDEQDIVTMRALLLAGRRSKSATYYVHVGVNSRSIPFIKQTKR